MKFNSLLNRRAWGALLASFLASCAGHWRSRSANPQVQTGRDSFSSGGRTIDVETFLPTGSGRHPAVLVLYGSGGAVVGKREMTDFAKKLAQRGIAAFVIHYFQRTGTLVAGDELISKHWRAWLDTVGDGVDFVAVHPQVKTGSLGAFGYSLGGFMAVSQGIRDVRIRAVVELAGGVIEGMEGRGVHFPPTLVLHGRQDDRVPVTRIAAVEREARRFGTAPEIKIYEGEGHGLSRRAADDAASRALAFFQRKLRP